jgi:hypothetical protein
MHHSFQALFFGVKWCVYYMPKYGTHVLVSLRLFFMITAAALTVDVGVTVT